VNDIPRKSNSTVAPRYAMARWYSSDGLESA